MIKFEKVSRLADTDFNLPVRKTVNSAGYDFEVAEDIVIPSYFDIINKINKEQWNREVAEYRQKLQECDDKYLALQDEYQKLEEQKALCEAQIKALRIENGSLSAQEEFAEKAGFDELEKEFTIFERFYKEQWKAAKKKIRKKTLTLENLRGQKGQDNQP